MKDENSRNGMSDADWAKVNEAADKITKSMTEVLSPAIKVLTDSIHEEIYRQMMASLENDTQYNFYSLVIDRANRIIKGLFSGGFDEATAREWLEGYDFVEYRKEVARNYPEIINNKIVEDLTKENERLRSSLEIERRVYGGRP